MPDENKIGVNSDLVPILPDENDDITEYLTDSSFESLKKRFAAAEEEALRGFSPQEMQQVQTLLERIYRNLND